MRSSNRPRMASKASNQTLPVLPRATTPTSEQARPKSAPPMAPRPRNPLTKSLVSNRRRSGSTSFNTQRCRILAEKVDGCFLRHESGLVVARESGHTRRTLGWVETLLEFPRGVSVHTENLCAHCEFRKGRPPFADLDLINYGEDARRGDGERPALQSVRRPQIGSISANPGRGTR